MFVLGALLWLAILGVYFSLWVLALLWLLRLQGRRNLMPWQSDGSVALIGLRIFVIATALFPFLAAFLYTPNHVRIGKGLSFVIPRLIEDSGTACAVAAVCVSILAVGAELTLHRLQSFASERRRGSTAQLPRR